MYYVPWLIFHVGIEYHHYDLFVYPRVMEVDKGYWVVKAGKGILKRLLPGEGKDGPLSAMARRCLFFYLEPYKSILLQDGEFPEGFEVDWFVRRVQHIYSLHRWPMMESSPKFTVVSIRDVRKFPTNKIYNSKLIVLLSSFFD